MLDDFLRLPDDLPAPAQDGACDHLPGRPLPRLSLPSTGGGSVDLEAATKQPAVFFVYPRTGVPGQPIPDGWDAVPGARGCTPQCAGFGRAVAGFTRLGWRVFGISSQGTDVQTEVVRRLGLTYEILSDRDFAFADALSLPTFVFDGVRLHKRLALAVERGRIIKAFYPVFPPDRSAAEVLAWLEAR